MAKLTKRTVDAAEAGAKDYVIWDDELPGFGLRVFTSGKRSYILQYRSAGRSRRLTIGLHGVWTPERARQEAKALFGRIAQGDDPAEERAAGSQSAHRQRTLRPLPGRPEIGSHPWKRRGAPKNRHDRFRPWPHPPSCHSPPRLTSREGPDEGRHHEGHEGHHGGEKPHHRQDEKLRGKSIVKGGGRHGNADNRTAGRHPHLCGRSGNHRDQSRARCAAAKRQCPSAALSEAEYRVLGELLKAAAENESYRMSVENHPPDRAHRMPPHGDDHAAMDGSRYRCELSPSSGQQGGTLRPADRAARCGISGEASD